MKKHWWKFLLGGLVLLPFLLYEALHVARWFFLTTLPPPGALPF